MFSLWLSTEKKLLYVSGFCFSSHVHWHFDGGGGFLGGFMSDLIKYINLCRALCGDTRPRPKSHPGDKSYDPNLSYGCATAVTEQTRLLVSTDRLVGSSFFHAVPVLFLFAVAFFLWKTSFYQVRTIFWHNRWSGAVPHVSNRMKRSNLQKKGKNILCLGGGGRKNFFTLSPSHAQSPKNHEKSLCPTVLQLRWIISTWWDENMTLYFQHDTRYIGTDFVGESRQKMQRLEEEHFFAKSALIGKNISNTANKRCSRQVLQLRCSSSYSIKFYT